MRYAVFDLVHAAVVVVMVMLVLIMMVMIMIMAVIVMVVMFVEVLVLLNAVYTDMDVRSRDAAFDGGLFCYRYTVEPDAVQLSKKAIRIVQQLQ